MIRDIKYYYRILGIKGLLCAIKAKITNTTVFYNCDTYSCNHSFCLRIPSSDVLVVRQVFIDREYDFSVESEPEIVVDAGANIGLASIYFANKYENAKILAIEPEKSNFDLLKKNVEPYPNIIPVHGALWNKNEEISVVDPGLGKWGFMTEKTHSATQYNKVMGMTVDRIMNDYGLDRINILKIDIEGAEKEVFSNASSWIEKVDAIIVELHERMKTGCNRSFYLNSNGFDDEWCQGENVYLSRGNFIRRKLD